MKHRSAFDLFTRFLTILLMCLLLCPAALTAAATAQSRPSRRPEIIRDTDIAEGVDGAGESKPKEPNPLLAEQNIDIGNFYYKKKNYAAAIQRYLAALEYQPDSFLAHEALARAYEKNKQIGKAIETYRNFIERYPDSPKCPEFRSKLAKLEKKAP